MLQKNICTDFIVLIEQLMLPPPPFIPVNDDNFRSHTIS
jgi:hypothetical protein